VNSRDLDTSSIDTAAAWRLLARESSDAIAVAESGMATADDVAGAAEAGADAALIGSALSRSTDPGALLEALTGVPRRGR
jgi:indole-3-glycerol phosphate synthase